LHLLKVINHMIGRGFTQFINAFFVLFLFAGSVAYGQGEDVDLSNIKNINVDDLTDDQIQRLIDEIDKRGFTESQLEVIARSRGVSLLQIEKLKQKLREVRSGIGTSTPAEDLNRLRTDQVEVDQKQEDDGYDLFSVLLPEEEEIEPEERIYGMELFQSENLTFQPSANIPTPKNYQLGAGDDVILDIWGASERTYQLTISPDGVVRIPNLGPIYLSGLTISEASRKLKSRLKSIYSNLNVNTYADISLGQVKSIRVNMVGEVMNQGSFVLSSFSSVFNALYSAGGPNENGSLRIIDHYRDGKKIATIDAYDYLFNGLNVNGSLNDQDLIIVRPYQNRVQFKGEIKRPGYYESKIGESLEQVIQYAGGFTSKSYKSNITVKRNKGLKRVIITVNEVDRSSFELVAGDEVIVGSITERFENRVQVTGAINKPGEYEYQEGFTLSQLIHLAEGLREDAFYERGSLLRLKADMSIKSIPFNLNDVLNGSDIELKNEDFVEIKSKFDLREEYNISIQGEVRNPGDYTYLDSMTVEDLILQAGGFMETASRSLVEVARRKSHNDNSSPAKSAQIFNFSISENLSLSSNASNFYLEPFDLVVIRKSPNYEIQSTVEIQGEANFPGKYVIEKKNERISDLLNRAGGITNYAYVKGATLTRRTEYFSEESSEAAKLRRENLTELAERDTLLDDSAIKLKKQESIGINLAEIIKDPGSKYDLILKEGDVLGVPKQLETIRLRGELLYPSTVRYDKTLTFKGYISQAGGFADGAKRGKSYVLYANGSVKRTKRFFWLNFYPTLEPGAEVIVPEKPEKRKITPGEIVGLTTGVATFGLIVLRLVDFLEKDDPVDNNNGN